MYIYIYLGFGGKFYLVYLYIEKLERNRRSDKSAQGLAWHIYYYLVSYRTFTYL